MVNAALTDFQLLRASAELSNLFIRHLMLAHLAEFAAVFFGRALALLRLAQKAAGASRFRAFSFMTRL